MQDESTGKMHTILQETFRDVIKGKPPHQVVQTGDTFMVRDCCFQIISIHESGIVAKGLSREEYREACKSRR